MAVIIFVRGLCVDNADEDIDTILSTGKARTEALNKEVQSRQLCFCGVRALLCLVSHIEWVRFLCA